MAFLDVDKCHLVRCRESFIMTPIPMDPKKPKMAILAKKRVVFFLISSENQILGIFENFRWFFRPFYSTFFFEPPLKTGILKGAHPPPK